MQMCISLSLLRKGNDMLSLHIALHICGQVKILKSNFIDFDVTEPQNQGRFNALIQRHGRLMEMTKILASVISFILLIQLFFSSLLLCTLGKCCVVHDDL